MLLKIVFVFIFLFASSFGKELPSFIEKCSLSDPKLSDCLARSIQKAAPSLNYPPTIPLLAIKLGDGALISLSNINYTAFKTMKVEDVKFDKETGDFYLKYTDPNMDALAYYDMDILFLGSIIKGSGPLLINFTDCAITYASKLNVVVGKKGIEHYEVKGGNVTLKPADAKFEFQNLFDGNEVLGKTTNNLLNEHWRDLYGVLQSPFQEVLAGVIDGIFNNYLKNVPKDSVFLP